MSQTIGKYLFDDDWRDDAFDAPSQPAKSEAQIRKEAHVANGGEASFACPKCGGSGLWGSYRSCFKCSGSGRVTRGVAAAAKGKATKEANRLKWLDDHAAEVAYVRKRADKGSQFYAGFLTSLDAYGTWTEKQVGIIQRDIAKDQEFWAKKNAEREAAAPKVEMSAIEKLFATAIENDVKKPIFRADGLEISRAPLTGKNAGALYVKAGGEYAGKIVGGKFHKVYAASADVVDRLMAVAADPLKEAMAYGRKFGNCSLCGRALVDPVSIRAKVGPVCAPKWGLDWMREAARESLAADEAAEEGQS